MAGGNKRGVYNTRERAVSDDQNRLQRFVASDIANRARFMYSAVSSHDLYSIALTTAGVVGDPLEMHILEGIVVLPQAGTSVCHVAGGTAFMVDPDGVLGSSDPSPASPDDNEFKYVATLGISDTTLTHSANAGPGIRIDVIECQRTEVVVESDSRDIFDPGTGTFSAVSVTKVIAGDMAFRLREGTAGAGFPGTAAGWTPIAVASVPAAFTSVDDLTYWDVRPLVSDRTFQPFNMVQSNPPHHRWELWVEEAIAATSSTLTGIVQTSLGAYRAGGTIRGSVPGTGDFDVINLLDTRYSDGVPLVADANFHVWCLQPFGLPRWARYDEGGSRFPGPFNGIAVVSLFPPAGHPHITPSVAMPLPASTGLLGTTTNAALIFAGRTHPTAGPVEIKPHSGLDGVVRFASANGKALAAPLITTATEERYGGTPNIEWPANARAIYVVFTTSYVGVAGVDAKITPQAHVFDPLEPIATATPIQVDAGNSSIPFVVPVAAAGVHLHVARIPLRQEWGPGALAPLTVQHFGITWNPVANIVGAPSTATVIGWEF